MSALGPDAPVAVLGCGAMGAGIAQVAAAAGHPVILFDAAPGAAARARDRVAEALSALVAKGRLAAEARNRAVDGLRPVSSVAGIASARLVVEAVVEALEPKRELLRAAEAAAPDAILATNTSSLSVTAIGAALARPERFGGLHFFNPAPVMRLVEVVRGAATDSDTTEALRATAAAWGKVVVTAKDTPGFIVNRLARPFYGEALRLLEEGFADPATLDAMITAGGGFRMGPFALMDLIGHDVNFAVTRSVFDATFGDPRYRPSQAQAALVAAGWLGRKSGRGFFQYGDATSLPRQEGPADALDGAPRSFGGATLRCTRGPPAHLEAAEGGPTILHDVALDAGRSGAVAVSASSDVTPHDLAAAEAFLAGTGRTPVRVPDLPGLVVLRLLAMLTNEAEDGLHHRLASAGDIELAMRHGVNWPMGPLAIGVALGRDVVLRTLDALHDAYRDPRYRASVRLRMRQG